MGLEYRSRRRDYVEMRPDAGFLPASAGDDVAVAVEAHALDPALDHHEVDHHLDVPELAVGLDRVRAQPLQVAALGVSVGDEEGLLVRRQQYRARPGRVVG